MRTYVYVDGFNLYYSLLKKQKQYKWLNLKALCDLILPRNNILKVNYYTAKVLIQQDETLRARQSEYWRALKTIPEIEIILGNFMQHEKYSGLVHPPTFYPAAHMNAPYPQTVKVWKTEEKGSDVNFASHLIADGYKDLYDVAIVITNDSDLREPMRIVSQDLGKPVGLLSPTNTPTRKLLEVKTFLRKIRPDHLRRSQFPDIINTANGDVNKPESWFV